MIVSRSTEVGGERVSPIPGVVRSVVARDRCLRGGSGVISLLSLDAGTRYVAPLRRRETEWAGYVLAGEVTLHDGAGTVILRPEHLFFAKSDAAFTLSSGNGPAQLLDVICGDDPEEIMRGSGDPPEREHVQRVYNRDCAVRAPTALHDPDNGFFNVAAEILISDDTCGSKRLVLGRALFRSEESMHATHRHPNATEFLRIINGDAVSIGASAGGRLRAGDFDIIKANEWHGHAGGSPEGFEALFGFLGIGSVEQAGYRFNQEEKANDDGIRHKAT